MTKSEFATRILFWLLPWPISKALPKALRIYYFGPTGLPPKLWTELPPYPPGWEPTPEQPLPPGWDPWMVSPPNWVDNPVDPPPDGWTSPLPPPPPAIVNPSDPYIPGPGHPPPATHPHPPGGCEQYCDDNYWQPFMLNETWTGNTWRCGCTHEAGFVLAVKTGTSWATGFRPSYFRMFFTGTATTLNLAVQPDILGDPAYTSGKIAALSFPGGDIELLSGDSADCGVGDYIYIQSIEFW